MRTLRIYLLNFHTQHTAVLIIFTKLYIPSLVLMYHIIGSLYLLTHLPPFLSPPTLPCNHKSDLFFYEFVCFPSIIDLQHCISSCYTTQWFDTAIHFKMITTVSLVTICHHTKMLHNYALCSPRCTFHARDASLMSFCRGQRASNLFHIRDCFHSLDI